MKNTLNILGKIADLSGYLSGCLVPLMVILVAYEVFMRYVLNNPPMIADEYSAYMLVALSYLGLSYTWRQGGHVRVSILVNHLPEKASNWLRLLGLVVTFVFMVAMTNSAYDMVSYSKMMGVRSQTWLMVPLFWPQMTILVGFVMLLFSVFSEFMKTLKTMMSGEDSAASLSDGLEEQQ